MCINIEDMWDEIHSKMREVINLVPINSNCNLENSNYNMLRLNSSLKRAIIAKTNTGSYLMFVLALIILIMHLQSRES